jgi:pimeloyl-ACP methyl ester carboxylesterase
LIRQRLSEPGLDGAFGCPDEDGLFPGVLGLGGSAGGMAEGYLDLLVPEGFACLALAYFGTKDTQAALIEVPLERIERGLRWLVAHPRVATQDGRVAVVGGSKGGELALLVAATFPDLVGPVVAYTPSSVVWAGIDFSARGGANRSSWSLADRPLPFVPYPTGVGPASSERGLSVLPIYDVGLDNVAAVEEAAISVERATGPVMLISGGDDRMWPAERMCRMVVERMHRHGRGSAVSHLNYPEAGHALFPYWNLSPHGMTFPFVFDLGGSPEAATAAHTSAWPQVVRHIKFGLARAGPDGAHG